MKAHDLFYNNNNGDSYCTVEFWVVNSGIMLSYLICNFTFCWTCFETYLSGDAWIHYLLNWCTWWKSTGLTLVMNFGLLWSFVEITNKHALHFYFLSLWSMDLSKPFLWLRVHTVLGTLTLLIVWPVHRSSLPLYWLTSTEDCKADRQC